MSFRECEEPVCSTPAEEAILSVIDTREKDLGGFSVRRVLPAASQRRVGPFIFFDHMGPATFSPGQGIDVRPHPHIGLSTLTYLFDGSIMHRDSLGYAQPIEPGAVNWMTAGSGIVHSERTPDELRKTGYSLHGIQSWMALPDGKEEIDPSFTHIPKTDLPAIEFPDAEMTLIAGSAFGEVSPVRTHSPLFYLHAYLPESADIPVPGEFEERAVYVVEGEITIGGASFNAAQMVILAPNIECRISASANTRLMLLGGAPLASDRIVWWNFSASSRDRIEQAKQDWRDGNFAAIEGETDFIPLPD